MQLLGEDRQLARLGVLQFAVDADQVAQVEALGQRPILLAHLLLADEQLDFAGPIADIGEDQLAGVAHQHDAAASTNPWAMLLAVFLPGGRGLSDDFGFPPADVPDGQIVVEASAPRIDP